MFSRVFNKKKDACIRILSIDGGGVRGIVAAVVLSYLEKKMQQLSNNKDTKIADYFDLFAGTSTGGLIIAALLLPDTHNRPKYSAADIVELYLKNSKIIFQNSFIQGVKSASGLLDVKYTTEGVHRVYQQYFTEQELKSLLKPCLIPVYDFTRGKNYFFRQHKAIVSNQHNYYLKDVMRAATSAINYFPPAQISTVDGKNHRCFVDGGMFAMNPALSAYAEFRYLNPHLYSTNTQLLSLGTGRRKIQIDCKKAAHWGAVEWRDPGSSLLTMSSSEASHYQLEAVYSSNPNYLRINPIIDQSQNAYLDDCTDEYLDFLRKLGTQAVNENKKALDNFAIKLLQSSNLN